MQRLPRSQNLFQEVLVRVVHPQREQGVTCERNGYWEVVRPPRAVGWPTSYREGDARLEGGYLARRASLGVVIVIK